MHTHHFLKDFYFLTNGTITTLLRWLDVAALFTDDRRSHVQHQGGKESDARMYKPNSQFISLESKIPGKNNAFRLPSSLGGTRPQI